MNKLYLHGIILMFLISVTACTSIKPKLEEPAKSSSSLMMLKTFKNNVLDFQTLEMKTAMEVEQNGRSIGFDATFRMRKDQLIWGVFKKFGFEAVRVKIQPDSVFVLNRLQKEYIAEDLKAFMRSNGLDLEFSDLQQMLLGGSPMVEGTKILNDSTLVNHKQIGKNQVQLKHFFNPNNELRQTELESNNIQGKARVEYARFESVGTASLAFDRVFYLDQNDKASVLSISTRNINLDMNKSTTFEIPKHYTRRKL